MNELHFIARDLDDTDRLGRLLADVLPDRTTVALSGTLGSGKTRLVQAIAAACEVPRESVVSPTFVLCQEYHGRRTLYHLDAYRLKDADEFLQLGAEEYFDAPALTLLEWAERVENCLPSDRLEIEIEILGESQRRFTIRALGQQLAPVLDELAKHLADKPNDAG